MGTAARQPWGLRQPYCLLQWSARESPTTEQWGCLKSVAVSLPASRFLDAPPVEHAPLLADAIRCSAGLDLADPVAVADLISGWGWTVERRRLGAAQGGLKAVMGPTSNGFLFVVDDNPAPDCSTLQLDIADDDRRRALFNRRLAHELGHVFFYRAEPPMRRLTAGSTAEEAYCDAFALALLLPPEAFSNAWSEPPSQCINRWGSHPACFDDSRVTVSLSS